VRAGILKGIRGPRGGYELGRERRRISAEDIFARHPDPRRRGWSRRRFNSAQPIVLPAVGQAEKVFATALARISVDDLVVRLGQ